MHLSSATSAAPSASASRPDTTATRRPAPATTTGRTSAVGLNALRAHIFSVPVIPFYPGLRALDQFGPSVFQLRTLRLMRPK
ncbi:hypothetical protein EJB05_02056 [Eragrostis curvula]|uniref:Uncharacterized protein n=1 Tax=Eragrostis curvula TaxID=38414 RepID=A0A5J9WRV7_9POAL|nr:hypothetical protein EJB05_02056 [Eragrostis curvula]